MAHASFISFLLLFLTSNFFNSSAQLGFNNKDHAVLQRAHHISSKPRLQSAKFEPSYEVSLHYSQSDPSQGYRYVAVVDWYMRVPALVALDQPEIESVQCDWDGIRIKFDSEKGALKARRWQRPMVLVTELKNTMCSYHDQNEEQYHPILLESIAEDAEHGSREVVFDGYRTRWDIVAYDHKVQIGNLAVEEQLEDEKLKLSMHKRNSIDEPNSFSFSPSINFDPQRKLPIKPSLPAPIKVGISNHTELSIACENCYVDSSLKLTIETGSCILDVGLTKAAKIIEGIHRAESALVRLLKSAAKATKEALISRFSTLADHLSNSLSTYYNCAARASAATDAKVKQSLTEELKQIALRIRQTSQALFNTTQSNLYTVAGNELLSSEKTKLIQQVQQVIKDADGELDAGIEIGSQLSEDPNDPDFCLVKKNSNLGGRSILSKRIRKRGTLINVSGFIKGNVDLKVSLTGKQTLSTGDLSLFSASLIGINIPGVLTIGPQVRMLLSATIGAQSSVNLIFGGDFEWSNLNEIINESGETDNTTTKLNKNDSNFKFNKHLPKFDIPPEQFHATNNFKPQIGFGIDFSLGKKELMVGLEGDLGLVHTILLPNITQQASGPCPGGINYDLKATAQLNGFVSTPTLDSSLLTSLTVKSLLPLWAIDPIKVFQHCFKMNKGCLEPNKTAQNPQTLANCSRITSNSI
ncbi:expressed protein [Phakopsora pachyrhizi]|uniref:Expressed protein n=1 Tax=Phakopsora pachyrhizi TaxID=170000 RepID=A0AAV0BGC7_PHAPC|nr:expressed protein [Phakopsora pachyrhizi]